MRPITSAAAAVLLLAPGIALARPPLLPAEEGCELWLGQAHGNDPSVRVNLRLCPGEGNALSGQLQWSSLTSGHNVRAVSGTRDGDAIRLRDERIVEEAPEPGWRFCEIDRYELTREGDQLRGTYRSSACDDSATVELRLVAGASAGTGPDRGPTPESQSESESESQSESEPESASESESESQSETESDSGCGCHTTRTPPTSLLVPVLLFAALRARRSRHR